MPQIQRFQLLESKLASLSLAHRSTLHYVVRHLARLALGKIWKLDLTITL